MTPSRAYCSSQFSVDVRIPVEGGGSTGGGPDLMFTDVSTQSLTSVTVHMDEHLAAFEDARSLGAWRQRLLSPTSSLPAPASPAHLQTRPSTSSALPLERAWSTPSIRFPPSAVTTPNTTRQPCTTLVAIEQPSLRAFDGRTTRFVQDRGSPAPKTYGTTKLRRHDMPRTPPSIGSGASKGRRSQTRSVYTFPMAAELRRHSSARPGMYPVSDAVTQPLTSPERLEMAARAPRHRAKVLRVESDGRWTWNPY
jgi:hypothetical protein